MMWHTATVLDEILQLIALSFVSSFDGSVISCQLHLPIWCGLWWMSLTHIAESTWSKRMLDSFARIHHRASSFLQHTSQVFLHMATGHRNREHVHHFALTAGNGINDQRHLAGCLLNHIEIDWPQRISDSQRGCQMRDRLGSRRTIRNPGPAGFDGAETEGNEGQRMDLSLKLPKLGLKDIWQ